MGEKQKEKGWESRDESRRNEACINKNQFALVKSFAKWRI